MKAVKEESANNWSGATELYKEFMEGIEDLGSAPLEFDFSLESYFKVLFFYIKVEHGAH